MMKQYLLLLCTLWISADVVADAKQPDAMYCLVCHGSNAHGSEVIGGPNLSILPEWYIHKQLKGFQQHWRGHIKTDSYGQEMLAVAQWMSEDDIRQAIHFIKDLPQKSAISGKVTGEIQRGKALYQTCAACHGSNGEGNKDLQAPPLAGQNDWYLAKQLQAFRQGERGTDLEDTFGMLMQQSAATVLTSEQDILDVVYYINTLTTQQKP
jgi:cytochrome c553